MVVEISVAIATLAFVALVIFLILTLIDFRRTLIKINKTLNVVEAKVDPVHDAALELIKNAKQITTTLNDHLQAVNPLVDAVHDVGAALQDASNEFSQELPKRLKHRKEERHQQWKEMLVNFLDLSAHAFNMWQQVKKRRK